MTSANVGDLIQYRYQPPKDFPRTTVRRVIALVESDAKGRLGYTVEGGFFVANKDVFTVIPMHEEETHESGGVQSLEPERSASFPMEAGQ